MADEIVFTVGLVYTGKTNLTEGFSIPDEDFSIDQSADAAISAVQTLTTSSVTNLFTGTELVTAGYWFVRNLNANTGIALLGLSGQTAAIQVLPGEFAVFRSNGLIYGQASVAAVRLQFYCFEA